MVRLLLGVVLLTTIGTVQHHTAALQLDATVGQEGFPWQGGGRPILVGRGIESLWSTLERTKLLRDRYPADRVSQLTRSNQWLIRPSSCRLR